MTKAYDRVLTALTYIQGPMVNDWVDTQENKLVTHTDTTQPNHIREDDKVLWAEFKTAFHDAWTDTSKKQKAYDQLMKLTWLDGTSTPTLPPSKDSPLPPVGPSTPREL